jgi:C-terminal processing protease CtpA/Prc
VLICLMVFALAAVPQPDEHAAIRQALIQQYQETDQLLREYDADIAHMAEPPAPLLGLRLATTEDGGQPVQRTTMVSGVLRGSVAARTGIQEGDRIVAIGPEPLDHESGKAVLVYLANYPDGVPLTVGRGSQRLEFVLHRKVVPCIAQVNTSFEAVKWQKRFATLRDILRQHAAHLPTMATMEGFEQAYRNLQQASALSAKMLDAIASERALAMATACVPTNTP